MSINKRGKIKKRSCILKWLKESKRGCKKEMKPKKMGSVRANKNR